MEQERNQFATGTSAKTRVTWSYRAFAAGAILLTVLSSVAWALTAYARSASAAPISPAATSSLHTSFTYRIVDYYPSSDAWTYMWEAWNPRVVQRDMARIAALHANTVRLIVQVPAFGYPSPRETMVGRLWQTVSMAHHRGLRVELSLFDWWHAYRDLTGSERWVTALLRGHESDRRIAFIELQNEIDPANAPAMAWAGQMIPFVHRIVGSTPVSLSISGRSGVPMLRRLKASLAATPPDLYDLHYYGAPALALSVFRQARQVVAPAVLINGETGYATTPQNHLTQGLPGNTAAQNYYQDQYIRTVEGAAAEAGLRGVGVWTLNDFSARAIPASTTARNPTEYHFGLYGTDGKAKPVAATIRSIFSGGVIDTSFNGGFETGAGALPANWLLWHGAQAHFAWDSTVAHSGAASARISASGGDNQGVPAFYCTPVAAITPGQDYRASIWARGRDASGNTRLSLAWFGSHSNFLGQSESAPLPHGTTGWTRLTVTASAPAGTAYVQIHLKSGHNAGTAWFDDVSFAGLTG